MTGGLFQRGLVRTGGLFQNLGQHGGLFEYGGLIGTGENIFFKKIKINF